MKKETKEFILGKSHIFDNTELDERQKAEAYKITFRLFIAMTYTMLILSMTVVFFAAGTPNTALLVVGTLGMIIAQLFIVLYAAMTSAKGSMNPGFAGRTSKPSYAVSSIVVSVVLFWMLTDSIGQRSDINGIFWLFYLFVYSIESLLLFYYSKRNMKVLENQLKEDED